MLNRCCTPDGRFFRNPANALRRSSHFTAGDTKKDLDSVFSPQRIKLLIFGSTRWCSGQCCLLHREEVVGSIQCGVCVFSLCLLRGFLPETCMWGQLGTLHRPCCPTMILPLTCSSWDCLQQYIQYFIGFIINSIQNWFKYFYFIFFTFNWFHALNNLIHDRKYERLYSKVYLVSVSVIFGLLLRRTHPNEQLLFCASSYIAPPAVRLWN